MARQRMGSERKDHTLQPSDLIHEAFIKLVQEHERDLAGRSHFFALAATIMRRILVGQRAGETRRETRSHGLPTPAGPGSQGSTIELDQALERLAKIDERQAQVVEMRFFGGFTEEEISEVLGVTAGTVKRDWVMARAWLFAGLGGGVLGKAASQR